MQYDLNLTNSELNYIIRKDSIRRGEVKNTSAKYHENT